ncbi:FtsB family cell division protein [[Eubacterium] hominis]|uniref:FtsB family cell division protein n=1 Tax=[Eubacterium] hominis TaxID=2764325 RepID=UPI003A4D84E3
MPEKNVTSKPKKKKHPIRTFFSLAAIIASCFLIYLAAEDFITTMNLRNEISESQASISTLQTEEGKLTDEIEKLNDPTYVQRYARGKYMVSKPGEQVFKLPSKDAAASDKED